MMIILNPLLGSQSVQAMNRNGLSGDDALNASFEANSRDVACIDGS